MKSQKALDNKIKALMIAYLGMINRPAGLKPLQALPDDIEKLVKGKG